MIPSLRLVAARAWHDSARRLALRRISADAGRRDLSHIAVVAALDDSNGITRGAQLQSDALANAGLHVEMVDATRRSRWRYSHTRHVPASAYVLHMAAPETAHLLHSVLPEAARAWRIGYWAWELPEPPCDWAHFDDLVHEIWTPSNYSARSLAKLFAVPIRVVPHRVALQSRRARERTTPFTVLAMADSRSSLTRKNPAAAVEAFRDAFGERRDVRLILKLGGSSIATSSLVEFVDGLTNVELVTRRLSDTEMYSLYRSTDVLLSLHRAEGFGLPMLEAMAHGVPAVGTGWSGNTDFMSEVNSALIPYDLVPVQDSFGIYGNDTVWAEPDTGFAARVLRDLEADVDYYERLASGGHEFVKAHQSLDIENIEPHKGGGRDQL